MLEGTPYNPYSGQARDYIQVEENMVQRRRAVEALLGEDEEVLTIPAFPLLGVPGFTYPPHTPNPETSVSRSVFFPDDAIFPTHPRFKLLTKNIRSRRGRKIAINMPVFKDTNTEDPFVDKDLERLGDEESKRAAKPNHVYMDAMGFGMGLSCLQVTFQARDIDEARYLYDQLANICPIMMAISAGTPVLRGILTATDTRWQVISASVDDRTKEESGEEPHTTARYTFAKSRYDSIDCYLSKLGAPFSDIEPFPIEPGLMAQLTEAGIDCLLARHIAHLFCRDPLTIYREKLEQDDKVDTDHFENIQSTNWQTLRFKPPPTYPDDQPNRRIGWRVEFRPIEIQFTDFENAALTVFVVLLTRVILTYHLNLVIPLSRVDENLKRGHAADAILNEKFFFRTNIFTDDSPPEAKSCCQVSPEGRGKAKAQSCISKEEIRVANESCRIAELTINQIVNGCEEFVGLIPLCKSYLDSMHFELEPRRKISVYLDLIAGRASGRYKTNARWMRDFIAKHPGYKHDSRLPEEVQYDMLKSIAQLSRHQMKDETLLPASAYFRRQPSTSNLASNLKDKEKQIRSPNGIGAKLSAPATGGSPSEDIPVFENNKLTNGESSS